MIGFGQETWRSTLPEAGLEKMGCGERKTMDRKKKRASARGCLGGSLVAEAVVTSFTVRTGTNPLVI